MPAPSAPAPVAAAPAEPAGPTLLDEERRLAALFDGTPVVFSMQAGNALRVDVPLRYCFEPGRNEVKPPLAAVLDRLAQSQRGRTSRFVVSAPGDQAPRSRPAASVPAAKAAGSAPSPTAGPGKPATSTRAAGRDAASTLAARRVASVRDRLAAQGIDTARTTVVESETAGIRVVVTEAPLP